MRAVLFISISMTAACVQAYTQNARLEQDLGGSDPKALALFPAEGFKDGAAGSFRTHALYVVPGSQRAWCADNPHGIMKPGCYVELYVQGEGFKPRNSRGDPCGSIGRWYQAPGSKRYVPTPGSFIANAMANGQGNRVEFAIYEEPGTKSSTPGSCDEDSDTPVHRR
jgi:hypothetical protein